MIFLAESLAAKARKLRKQYGHESAGVHLSEAPGSTLQWSTTTPGAQNHGNHVSRRKGH